MENKIVENLNLIIKDLKALDIIEENDISDGHHTFNELYEFRKLYNALLANELSKHSDIEVYKTKKHNDGEDCFGGGWFLVVIVLPTGIIDNHYKLKDWDLFQVPEIEKEKSPYDGHTAQDVIDIMLSFIGGE